MKAAITGINGFVGRHLAAYLKEEGFDIAAVPRSVLEQGGGALVALLEGSRLVIHLSGAPVVGRWTQTHKQMIYNSRIFTTRTLVEAMAAMDDPPSLFICASGVGIYPDSGIYTEDNTRVATGFLAEVVRDWELEALKASVFARTLTFRFGMILGKNGGALKTMALPFRFGLGGKIGTGKQMISWVHIDDVCRAVGFSIKKKTLFGPLNVSSPYPVSNQEFSRVLARILRRPAYLPVPAFALKLLYGEGASVVTEGQTAIPERLRQEGFQFKHPKLEEALNQIFKTKNKKSQLFS